MSGKTIRSNNNISVAKVAQEFVKSQPNRPKRKNTAPVSIKKLKSLLVPNKNITKIDPALRKRSMTNIRINNMVSSFLKNMKPKAKKQKSKK